MLEGSPISPGNGGRTLEFKADSLPPPVNDQIYFSACMGPIEKKLTPGAPDLLHGDNLFDQVAFPAIAPEGRLQKKTLINDTHEIVEDP